MDLGWVGRVQVVSQNGVMNGSDRNFGVVGVVGAVILALSGLTSGAGAIFNSLTATDEGANIGAALLILAGLPLALTGAVVLLVDLVLYLRARHSATRGSR